MLNILITVLLCGLGTFYFANVLVYDFGDEDQNGGPFRSKTFFVYNSMTLQSRSVNIFDIIRRLFGFYQALPKQNGTTIWNVQESQTEGVWSCPHCLGFWIAFILVMIFAQDRTVYGILLSTCAAAGVSSLLFYHIGHRNGEGLQLRSEESEDSSSRPSA